ncbi:MAG: hypothetical protein IJ191_00700 [Treponema sp.]|nr:hypothetical protein [Treponema sp.]
MWKKMCILLIVAISEFSLWAHGRGDVIQVDSLNSWQESIDITRKKSGKYNILVTATDGGGNQSFAGPYNIYIDPKSDLPVVAIMNPVPNMRIIGDLNIVGTCFDDDAVDYVELIIDGNKREPVRAEGKEMWSYYIDTSSFSEGTHTVSAIGYDINGTASAPITVAFNLDREAPVTAIESHGMGTIANGTVRFQGTVIDGNGIASLHYSLDNDTVQYPVKLKSRKNSDTARFQIQINTVKELSDGPHVMWFRAVDTAGSSGIYSFLFYVDNTDPELEILWPHVDEVQSGTFSIAGRAKDALGISRLTYTFGKQSGELDIIPGNPYWVHEFNTSLWSEKSARFTITATDGTGNTTTCTRLIQLNQSLSKPHITLSEPRTDNVFTPKTDRIIVRGFATDDNAIQSVRLQVDGKDHSELSTQGAYLFDIDSATLAAGKHVLSVTALDVDGNESDRHSVSVVTSGTLPTFGAPEIITNRKAVPAIDGTEVHPESNATFQTTVSAGSTITHIDWRVNDGTAYSHSYDVNTSQVTVSIPLSDDAMPKGVVTVTVRATDAQNRSVSQQTVLYIKNTTKIEVDEPRVVFDDSDIAADGSVTLDELFPLTGYFIGGKIDSVAFVPQNSVATVTFTDNTISIRPRPNATGASGQSVVRVTTTIQGRQFSFDSRPLVLNVRSDEEKADLAVFFASVDGEPYAHGKIVTLDAELKPSATLTAIIDTEAAVSSAKYEITGENAPGGAAVQSGSAKLTKLEDGSSRYTADIPLENLPARSTDIALTIRAGKATKTIRGTLHIVRPAEIFSGNDERRIYPLIPTDTPYTQSTRSYTVQTNMPVVFYANVPGAISAQLATPNDNLFLEENGKVIKLKALAEGQYNNIVVQVSEHITDGQTVTYTSAPINITVSSSKPEIHLISPTVAAYTNTTVKLQGTATGTSGIKSIAYSVDGGEHWADIPFSGPRTGVTFSQDIPLAAVPDGLVLLDVRVTDNAGNESYTYSAITKDTVAPEVQIIMPTDGETINGENIIAFSVRDASPLSEATYSERGERSKKELSRGAFITTHIGTDDQPFTNSPRFEFTDAAGNVTIINRYDFNFDAESDKPAVEIHIPAENEVITRDFTISGLVYDDDGHSTIYYRIDDQPYQALPEIGTSFSIAVPLSEISDNEHSVTIYAADINGVRSDEIKRTFRISHDEPKGEITSPTIETMMHGLVEIKGIATDGNGINTVQISLDNGRTYNDVSAIRKNTGEWTYSVDTRAIPDSYQVLFVKMTDNYGIEGVFSHLVGVDNNPPHLEIAFPMNDSISTGELFFSGEIYDTIGIAEAYISLFSLEGHPIPNEFKHRPLATNTITSDVIDIHRLPNGYYNVEVTAIDNAGNTTRRTCNIELNKNKVTATVDVLYPFDGEHKQGIFDIYGSTSSEEPVESLYLIVDNVNIAETAPSTNDFFKFSIDSELLGEGRHSYQVVATLASGERITSRTQTLTYSPYGPWITIDNFTYGDFAIDRPHIRGTAGYAVSAEEQELLKNKTTPAEVRQAIQLKKLSKVEISFNNGKTFSPLSKKAKWKYRIENEDLEDGFYFLLLRATMANGEVAVTRTIVSIDNTHPSIHLIAPRSGGHYNQELVYAGTATDNILLQDITLALRKGDKAFYGIPSFVQGLYIDASVWGATLFSIGVGLTFFRDIVKVQLQWGQFTQAQRDIFDPTKSKLRFGGDSIVGIKLMANVASIPFAYLFGRNFEWLSASFAVGANFSFFNQSATGTAQILSALIAQMEFPRITLKKRKVFKTFAFYGEFSLWFVSTDVRNVSISKNVIPQWSVGFRHNIF